jgi:pilus assembly protein Flp/PilA
MNNVKKGLTNLWRNDDGLTTVEYAIAGALVGLAVVGMFTNLGSAVGNVISNLVSAVNS